MRGRSAHDDLYDAACRGRSGELCARHDDHRAGRGVLADQRSDRRQRGRHEDRRCGLTGGRHPDAVNAGGKRGFDVNAKNVIFSGVAITNGNGGLTGGGAIAVNATATGFVLSDSTIFGNVGNVGGGVEVFGTALIERSTFSGNSAVIKGGGIHASGTVEVVNSTFTGNTGGRGGAIAVWSLGKGAISYSTFVDNTSYGRLGGGVDRYSGSLVVTGSVLTAQRCHRKDRVRLLERPQVGRAELRR